MNQSVYRFGVVHFLQRGQRGLPGVFVGNAIEADLRRTGFHQCLSSDVRDDLVVRVNSILGRVVDRFRRNIEQGLVRLAKPGQANYDLQLDTRILVAQRFHKQGRIHTTGLALAIGEGSIRPFANGFVGR